MSVDILDEIDAVLSPVCCSCQKPLAADGPSADFCTELCQALWYRRDVTSLPELIPGRSVPGETTLARNTARPDHPSAPADDPIGRCQERFGLPVPGTHSLRYQGGNERIRRLIDRGDAGPISVPYQVHGSEFRLGVEFGMRRLNIYSCVGPETGRPGRQLWRVAIDEDGDYVAGNPKWNTSYS